MYVRHVLLITAVSFVLPLQAPSYSTTYEDAQSTKEAVTQTGRHPDAMSNFEAMLFIENLTGCMFSVFTFPYQDCYGNFFEVYIEATNEAGSCGIEGTFHAAWLSPSNHCSNSETCTSYTHGPTPEVWPCDPGPEECNGNVYISMQHLCDEAADYPCDFLAGEIFR